MNGEAATPQLLPLAASPFYGEALPKAVKGCFSKDKTKLIPPHPSPTYPKPISNERALLLQR